MAVRSLFPILISRDLPRLVSFYEHALHGRVRYRFGSPIQDDYVSLSVGEASLGIGRDPAAPVAGTGDRVSLWFYVDDVDSAFARWMTAGGDVVQEPADMPWGERAAQVRDPDGNLVNLGAEASASPD